MKILVLNCGSSSVKFQLIDIERETVLSRGMVEAIGSPETVVRYQNEGLPELKLIQPVNDHQEAIALLIEVLTNPEQGVIEERGEITAVGHRVAHGGEKFFQAVLITPEVKEGIQNCFDLAPLHNPHNYAGIKACEKIFPNSRQVAVFDTAFHQTVPPYAYIYGLPYNLYRKYNLRRYGFHGTSHQYVTEQAALFLERKLAELKVVSCHLGNGASITAIQGGRSVDTSMGFTPLEGLVMGTRCGDMDPAIIPYLMASEGYSLQEITALLNNQSGLYGISGVSGDLRQVIAVADQDNKRAKLAIEVFVYRIKKYIASYAGAMNGLDVLIFTAGIGENSPYIRQECCKDLSFFGIELDPLENKKHVRQIGKISSANSKVVVLTVPTNEELSIARQTRTVIENSKRGDYPNVRNYS